MKEKALDKAMRLCSRSEKCAKDVKNKLLQWKVSANLHSDIITELYDKNFLNDARYAKSYVNDKINLSRWGKQKIFFALKLKEIPEDIIQQALDEVDTERYLNGLVTLLETKQKNLKADSDYEKMGKLIRYGQSRGFTMSEINIALNRIL
ncbi:regulatory protein [Balneicella halophila]|uniref:Regulatory protein RecX n=1 Tax=Balneicella halophila TaxID=1537566 RepID=A0A7L4UP75_BALHA|nr:regulatory protein RecX [Balneicella halophila]PVX50834.1 regulatory protein [Balneicella halophila]